MSHFLTLINVFIRHKTTFHTTKYFHQFSPVQQCACFIFARICISIIIRIELVLLNIQQFRTNFSKMPFKSSLPDEVICSVAPLTTPVLTTNPLA